MALFAERAGANAGTESDNSGLKLAGRNFNGNTCRQFILGVRPYKACSWCHITLAAGSYRPRIEAESRAAAIQY
jgi:hypothetical protein